MFHRDQYRRSIYNLFGKMVDFHYRLVAHLLFASEIRQIQCTPAAIFDAGNGQGQ